MTATIHESPVQVKQAPAAIAVSGLVDLADGHAFVRTAGYRRGPDDIYVSAAQIRQYGLRKGDLIEGTARPQPTGTARGKFRPLLAVATVNSRPPGLPRPHFDDLTPLYPDERLRLEDGDPSATARIIDLLAPIGKGQRGLIVAPPKAGKTMVLRAIATAIANSHPEVTMMLVLVGERPEEVTDLRRSVRGEVIFSTFDQAAEDHIRVAELAIERAKRLVETGADVVVLLDSLTRLGRAYNLAAPASSRTLAGGVAASALQPPRQFLGAARNIEDGGSLTIVSTALVGAAAPPRTGRAAHLPRHRRDALRHPPRRPDHGSGRVPGRRHAAPRARRPRLPAGHAAPAGQDQGHRLQPGIPPPDPAVRLRPLSPACARRAAPRPSPAEPHGRGAAPAAA